MACNACDGSRLGQTRPLRLVLGETILGLRESVIVTTIYSNFKALELSNAETLIVARSCVPCVVAFGPYLVWAEALHEHALNIPDGSDWPCV